MMDRLATVMLESPVLQFWMNLCMDLLLNESSYSMSIAGTKELPAGPHGCPIYVLHPYSHYLKSIHTNLIVTQNNRMLLVRPSHAPPNFFH